MRTSMYDAFCLWSTDQMSRSLCSEGGTIYADDTGAINVASLSFGVTRLLTDIAPMNWRSIEASSGDTQPPPILVFLRNPISQSSPSLCLLKQRHCRYRG
jgi:hypothetical protein